MRRIAAFELRPVSGPAEPPRAELVYDGKDLGVEVDGVLLEAQFQVGEQYILLVTDDCPYEEMLHIHLLGSDKRAIERVQLGAPYTPGVLRAVEPSGDRELSFEFGGAYRLTVRAAPRWRRHLELESA